MRGSSQRRSHPTDSNLPRGVAAALDASADDLRHDRVEDAATFLERVQTKIDAYKAKRRAATGSAGKR